MPCDNAEILFVTIVFFFFPFAPPLSCVAQWMSYQEARQTVIELMNEAEKKLTEFSTAKAATSEEAEDKLCSHRVRESQSSHATPHKSMATSKLNFDCLLSPLCR